MLHELGGLAVVLRAYHHAGPYGRAAAPAALGLHQGLYALTHLVVEALVAHAAIGLAAGRIQGNADQVQAAGGQVRGHLLQENAVGGGVDQAAALFQQADHGQEIPVQQWLAQAAQGHVLGAQPGQEPPQPLQGEVLGLAHAGGLAHGAGHVAAVHRLDLQVQGGGEEAIRPADKLGQGGQVPQGMSKHGQGWPSSFAGSARRASPSASGCPA